MPRSDLLNVYSCCPACKKAGTPSSSLNPSCSVNSQAQPGK